MPKFKFLFKFGVVLTVMGIILITLGYFMPYRNIGQIDFYYHYLDPPGQFVYQGERYYLANPQGWTFEGGKQYMVTLTDYETPERWKGNASDSKIFFLIGHGPFTATPPYYYLPEKVILLAKSSTFEFILDHETTCYVELATNLSREQMREQGYFGGDWILTFTIEYTAPGHYDYIFIGIIFLVVGSIVIITSKW